MKHCDEYSELISAFIDNEISDQEAEQLKSHLAACPDCRAYLLYLEKIHTETAALAQQVPDGFSSRVMQSIAASEKAQKRFVFARFKFTAIAAAIVLLVFAAGRLESFFPQIAENSSDAAVQEAAPSDVLPENRPLVPATITPMRDLEKEADTPPTSEPEKARTVEKSRVVSENSEKKEAPAEVKPEKGDASPKAPELEKAEVSAIPPVENSSEAEPSAPAQDQTDAVADNFAAEDSSALPTQDGYDSASAPSAGGGSSSAAAGAGVAGENSSLDAGAIPESGSSVQPEQDSAVESEDTAESSSEDKEELPPAMPKVPQSESYAYYIAINGDEALSLFSEHSSKIFEGNYLISMDKAQLSSTLSLLESSGFSYYRYDGEVTSPNFLLIIIP